MYTLITILHMCTPFLSEHRCPWHRNPDHLSISLFSMERRDYISAITVNFIDLFCTLVYLVEISLRLAVNNSKGRFSELLLYKDKWIFIRLLCVSLIFIDSVVCLVTQIPVRFGRCLIPVIYIARRNSLRQMVHGLFLSVINSFPILMFLVAVHFFWSFLGYIVFRGVYVEYGDRFHTFGDAMLTVLQSATSRSFGIFALMPYYEITSTSALFFFALTVTADLICVNLIVAVGFWQYKGFSKVLFRRLLRNRRQAFVAIHDLLSDERGFISRDKWIAFCSNIRGKYSVTRQVAEVLFSLECEKMNTKEGFDCIDSIGLFRISALLSARVIVDISRPENGIPYSSRGFSSLTEECLQRRNSHKPAVSYPSLEKVQKYITHRRSYSDPCMNPCHYVIDEEVNAVPRHESPLSCALSEPAAIQGVRIECRSRVDSSPASSTDVRTMDEFEISAAETKSTSTIEKMYFSMRLRVVQMMKYSIALERILPQKCLIERFRMTINPFDGFFFCSKVTVGHSTCIYVTKATIYTVDSNRMGARSTAVVRDVYLYFCLGICGVLQARRVWVCIFTERPHSRVHVDAWYKKRYGIS